MKDWRVGLMAAALGSSSLVLGAGCMADLADEASNEGTTPSAKAEAQGGEKTAETSQAFWAYLAPPSPFNPPWIRVAYAYVSWNPGVGWDAFSPGPANFGAHWINP